MRAAVCIKECPKEGDIVSYIKNVDVTTDELVSEYETMVLGQFCLPNKQVAEKFVRNILESVNKTSSFTKYIIELSVCYWILFIMVFGTVAISIIYILLLMASISSISVSLRHTYKTIHHAVEKTVLSEKARTPRRQLLVRPSRQQNCKSGSIDRACCRGSLFR